MTQEETVKRIEEDAEKVATNLGWNEDGTAERHDIIRAYKDGAKSERNKTIDEVIEGLQSQHRNSLHSVDVIKYLESLKVDL